MEYKRFIAMRLLTRPPPPCGNLVKTPRKTATVEIISATKIIIAEDAEDAAM